MPKRKIVKVVDGNKKKFKAGSKFRIGTRRAGSSAFTMPSQKLIDIVMADSESRYHNKALQVLKSRGIEPKFLV